MNTISSLPITNKTDSLDAWLNVVLPKQHFKGLNKSQVIYEALEEHIPLWKSEHSQDITHFNQILGLELDYEDLIARVLYECMQKNDKNITFIKSRDVNTKLKLKSISKEKYPILYETVSNINLEHIKDSKGIMACLNLLQDNDILGTILYSIYKFKPMKLHKYRPLNFKNKTDLSILKYILKNPTFYSILSSSAAERTNVKNLTSTNLEHLLNTYNVINYLGTATKWNNNIVIHLEHILNNLNIIFENQEDKLLSLTGLFMFSKEFPLFKSLISTAYKEHFPAEYKLAITLQSLGMTDFKTVMSTISNTQSLQTIESVELPLL